MRASKRALAVACLSFATASIAHAATMSIPVQGGMISDSVGTNCYMSESGATVGAYTCDVSVPLSLPVGTKIQQISVVYQTNSAYVGSTLGGTLILIDAATGLQTNQFMAHGLPSAPGTFTVAPMMSQFGKTFPDTFSIQGDIFYHVDLHIERGMTLTGLEVTYQ